ncbi:sigma-70 family RNA polymerase sigma factor [Allobranchiibius sp. CTAmp26]|uniref:sigma-70 family RNA polymerase sigma factor n=1 Tax=Allobranchiibius sp. CTAmp26 TaxID=2815214 RepID=UPI001AA16895|nr:sigma-70 family RNA polymerase sigma factor [Allobranchiibius sp. CTAmp26]MBO1754541.1 sigma-70 family RNA polymerase sigma factor [Allobranchiibius sp. CTAmp26]
MDLLERAAHAPDDTVAAQLRAEAIQENIALAHAIARRYAGLGAEAEDLQQVASLALVMAVARFDPGRGSAFTAYARITIDGELKRHLRDHGWAVRPPRNLHDVYHEVRRATQDLTQTLGTTPTVADIAHHLQISDELVRDAQRVGSSYTATSLDALLVVHPDSQPGDRLNLGTVGNVDTLLTALVLREGIRALEPRDRLILQLRFEQEMTQLEIGHHLGISQMQVSRVLAGIIARLRECLDDHAERVSA